MRGRSLIAVGAMLLLAACGSVRVPAGAQAEVIPWIDATPPVPTPVASVGPTIPTGTPSCRADELQATFDGGAGVGGGQLYATISFHNRGDSSCFLQGVPSLTLLDAQGHPIKTTPSEYLVTDRTDPVLLRPRAASKQAYVSFVWPAIDMPAGGLDCPSPAAATIWLDLPDRGGRLTLSTAQPSNGRTQAVAPCHGLIAVGAFQMVEPPTVEATPPAQLFSYHVTLPPSVRAGENLRYTVTLTNLTSSPVSFSDPCPIYHEDLYPGAGLDAPPLGKHIYVLNCGPVKSVASKASVTFAMVLDVPAVAPSGRYTLLWDPEEGTSTAGVQRLTITVTH